MRSREVLLLGCRKYNSKMLIFGVPCFSKHPNGPINSHGWHSILLLGSKSLTNGRDAVGRRESCSLQVEGRWTPLTWLGESKSPEISHSSPNMGKYFDFKVAVSLNRTAIPTFIFSRAFRADCARTHIYGAPNAGQLMDRPQHPSEEKESTSWRTEKRK